MTKIKLPNIFYYDFDVRNFSSYLPLVFKKLHSVSIKENEINIKSCCFNWKYNLK